MKWFHRLKAIITQLLKQGVTPEHLAWTFGWGATLSIFPLLGTTTALCFFVATRKKYNHAVIQAVNYAVTPIHLVMIPLFLRAGEKLFRLPSIPFDPVAMKDEFFHSPGIFLRNSGASILAAIAVWCIIAFPLAFGIQRLMRPALERMMRKRTITE